MDYLTLLIQHAKERYPEYAALPLDELIDRLAHHQHVYAYSLACQLQEAQRKEHTQVLHSIT